MDVDGAKDAYPPYPCLDLTVDRVDSISVLSDTKDWKYNIIPIELRPIDQSVNNATLF